ncbi:MAG: magnesium transporter [Parvularculaceae bacterium]|nr:magnesium transporter [Parvularculaceae bacterium]
MPDPVILDDSRNGPETPAPQQESSALHDELTFAERYVEPVAEAVEARDVARIQALFDELHPADLADVIALLHEDDRLSLIELLGGSLPAEVLPELDPGLTEEVVTAMRPEAVAEAVSELDTDDAAFILEELDDDKREEILAKAAISDRLALNQAFDYEEESAGRLMQREVFAAPSYWTVGQIIDRLRGKEELPDRFYEVFVVDPGNKPIGAVPLATLLKTQRDIPIESIMNDDLWTIPVSMDQEDVAYKFEQYNLISAPVVDDSGRLVGMITVDDVVEIVHAESAEDMLALGGVESDAGITDTVMETVRSRFSWLAVNLGTAILASLVISLFGAAIEKVVALAVLMPIVASMGGNAGTQTLTVAVRSLAMRDLTTANAARIVWRETIVGGLNGIMFALIMGVLAAVWRLSMGASESEAIRLGGVIGAAMIINLIAAGLAGILIPLGLQRAGADPAVSSAVFVTTVTDVVGFFVFLGLAAAVLL